jgi:hypothetical protein
MSRLYLSEEGNVVPTLCEELTKYRRARKVLNLPPTADRGTLFLLARQHRACNRPLRLSVNNAELPPIEPKCPDWYTWHAIPVDPSSLISGPNVFEFWTDETSMTAWSLAIEAGHSSPASYISDDAGVTWRNRKMAYLNVLSGEYVVRMRLSEGNDPTPPPMVWEEPDNPRLGRLRDIAPHQAVAAATLLDRVRSLTSWLSTSWEHTDSARAAQYAPWDAETILAWGKTKCGHNGRPPNVMCVHYAVAFVSFCQAVGIYARGVALADNLNGTDGHFVAEVWFPEFKKWVMVDVNLDAMMWKNRVPLSTSEVREAGSALDSLVEWGPGTRFQLSNPAIKVFIENTYLTGRCFKHRGIWSRADFLLHPDLTPAGHGSTAYCETSFVWDQEDLNSGYGMFPYFGPRTYFEVPPVVG